MRYSSKKSAKRKSAQGKGRESFVGNFTESFDDDFTESFDGNFTESFVGKGKGAEGGGESSSPTFQCNPSDLIGFSFLKNMLKSLGLLFIVPIIVILFSIPISVTLYMTFNSCKSFTFDYIYYISELFCKMQEHSGTIRFMFYAVTIAEIVKYVQKRKFKAIINL